MKYPSVYLAIATFFIAPLANAQAYHSLSDIHTQVKKYITSELDPGVKADINVSNLDKRLRLKKCPQKLKITTAYGQALAGKTTLSVKCPAQNWALMVPAGIDLYLPVFIAKRPLSRGNIIQDADFSQVTRKVSLLPSGYINESSQLKGYKVKRFIRQGSIIPPSALAKPKLVNRGQRVDLVAKSGNLIVRMKGEAMSDGVRNQLIRVKNQRSKRIVEGTVIEPGTVLVKM